MNVARSSDVTVQPGMTTLHIPASSSFLPFPQFSLTDGSTLHHPADDNNNKPSLPVVSLVAAVSGLCPAISVVSMQQPAHLTQAVVASTIIPTLVTPITVQTANCFPPTSTSTINIAAHLTVPASPSQPTGINPSAQSAMTATNNQAFGPSLTNMTAMKYPPSNNATSANSQSCLSSNPTASSKPTTIKENASSSKNSSLARSKTCSNNSDQTDDLIKPVFRDGELVLDVECGQNKGLLHLSKLCQGSKGPCISFQSSWLTPNEFQFVSGRETAKDWKRSIRHHGKSLKLLLARGILNVHPTMCDCEGCRQGATLTRKGEKRRIPNNERKSKKPSSPADRTSSGITQTASNGSHQQKIPRPSSSKTKTNKGEGKCSKTNKTNILQQVSRQDVSAPPPTPIPPPPPTSILDPSRQSSPHLPPAPTCPPSSTNPDRTEPTLPSLLVQSNYLPGSKTSPPTPTKLIDSPAGSPVHLISLLCPTPRTSSPSHPTQTCLSLSVDVSPNESDNTSHPDLAAGPPCVTCSPGHTLSPTLPNTVQAESPPPLWSSQYGAVQSNFVAVGTCNQSINDSESSDEGEADIHVGNETDASFHSDDRSSDVAQKSGEMDERSNDTNELSDEDDSQNKWSKLTSNNTLNNLGTASQSNRLPNPSHDSNGDESHLSDDSLTSCPGSGQSEKSSSLPISSSPKLSPKSEAVSSSPHQCSTSTANIKSEHIWIPPTLSPSLSHVQQQEDKRYRTPLVDVQSSDMTIPRPDPTISTSNTEGSKHSHAKKQRRQSQSSGGNFSDRLSQNSREINSDITVNRTDIQFSSSSGYSVGPDTYDNLSNGATVKQENKININPQRSRTTTAVEKSHRDRAERHRQRVKEDKCRRERDRRERAEVDREERQGLAETHPSSRDNSRPSSGDAGQRALGGVAEAAAFSDYMRALAAGHGQVLMTSTPGFVPTYFQARPPERPLPAHLLHPMGDLMPQLQALHKDSLMYPSSAAGLSVPTFSPLQPWLQRHPYSGQPSLLDYQRSLWATYQWPTTYPYFLHEVGASQVTSAAKRSAAELEAAAADINSKRMRMDMRPAMNEYPSPWDYLAATPPHLRLPPPLPCGLESANMDKTSELLRKRYLEYGASYLTALPEYSRSAYHCACADHREEDIRWWNVEEVCKFLSALEGCGLYVEHFREQRVTGRILSLLTTEHLVKTMGMKLGPAVVLYEAVVKKLQDASKLSSCDACRNMTLGHSVHPMVLPL